ncbi:MAG: hypothetical protein LM517_04480, partial [Nitrosomonas sp.]|nr:hypothetical protein [Nitrosomonas sp.]
FKNIIICHCGVLLILIVDLGRSLSTDYTALFSFHTPEMIIAPGIPVMYSKLKSTIRAQFAKKNQSAQPFRISLFPNDASKTGGGNRTGVIKRYCGVRHDMTDGAISGAVHLFCMDKRAIRILNL